MFMKMLREAVSSPPKPLKRAAESAFEVALQSEETGKRLEIKMSYCCSISEEKNMSAAR